MSSHLITLRLSRISLTTFKSTISQEGGGVYREVVDGYRSCKFYASFHATLLTHYSIYLWLTFVPLTFGLLAMFLYAGAFNRVNWNKFGVKNSEHRGWFRMRNLETNVAFAEGAGSSALAANAMAVTRRRILIATLECELSKSPD